MKCQAIPKINLFFLEDKLNFPNLWRLQCTIIFICISMVHVSLTTTEKHKFWIYSTGLYEFFSGILVKIFNCGALSPFETVLCSLIKGLQFLSLDNQATSWYAQPWGVCCLKKQINLELLDIFKQTSDNPKEDQKNLPMERSAKFSDYQGRLL